MYRVTYRASSGLREEHIVFGDDDLRYWLDFLNAVGLALIGVSKIYC